MLSDLRLLESHPQPNTVMNLSVAVLSFLRSDMRPVCLVAYLGLFMLCVSYQVDERTCIQFAMKLLYFVLSALGLTVCVLAVAFAAHHYAQLAQFTCGTALDSCQCKLPSSEPLSRTFVYRDVTDCTSITGTFKLFLLIQMILNLVCGLVCLLACFVMWKHRIEFTYSYKDIGTKLEDPVNERT
ncbi:hypothetical protein E5288_WYG013665 [Bos mutus]|uniref:Sarcospan n=1 Tax=Bos mutus TaxID=72004 RepID=A0A6B0QWJ7_9CETA|nr:hypothetical protein [Bos mutus]